MKSKGLLCAMMVGVLAVGGTQAAIAGVVKKPINPQPVKVVRPVKPVKDKEEATKKQSREIAVKAFEKYFNEKLDINKLGELISVDELDGQKLCSITWTNQEVTVYEGEKCVDMNKGIIYSATIDVKSGKVLYMDYFDNNKKENIQNFDLEEAKNIASDFIQKNELLNTKDIQFNEESSKEVSKDRGGYYLYFKYDKDKTLLITVDKTDKKVTQMFFIDELNCRG